MKKIFFALVCVLNIFVAYKGYELLTLAYDSTLDDRLKNEKLLNFEARFSSIRVSAGTRLASTYYFADFVDAASEKLVTVRLTALLNKTFDTRRHPFVKDATYFLELVPSRKPVRGKRFDGVPQYDIISIESSSKVIASIHSDFYKKNREMNYKVKAVIFVFLVF